MKIDIYTHYFKVTEFTDTEHSAILRFCTHLSHEEKSVNEFGQPERVIGKTYAARTRSRSEYRFIISCYDIFIRFCDTMRAIGASGHRITDHRNDVPFGFPITLKPHPKYKPFDYQVDLIAFAAREPVESKPNPPLYKRVLEIQTGKGKDQPLDALIKVPGGWKRMGDMQVGTLITAPDGTTTKVTGVFPQGMKQVYRVTFADGRFTECGAGHLWKVYYINTVPNRRWRVVDTLEMLRLISMPNPRVYVQLCESEMGEDVNLPIDPYLLGVMLGDGSIGESSVTITKGDSELFSLVRTVLPPGLTFSNTSEEITKRIVRDENSSESFNSLVKELSQLGLAGKRSWEKFIPKQYLSSSTEQRWAILQGLMDTDGTVNSKESGGAVSFCSSSIDLAKGVQYLVRSLGGIASISIRRPHYSYKGEKLEGRVAYDVNIRMKTPSKLFRLTAKKGRTNDDNQYAADLKLRVVSITPKDIVETQCISVEHEDHLYVTDDFIVTHNTLSALMALTKLGIRTLIQIKPMYISKWVPDIQGYLDDFPGCEFKKTDICVIAGGKALANAIAAFKEGNYHPKFVIIANRTYQIYLEEYEAGEDVVAKYGCLPDEMLKIMGIGVKLTDEAHEYFHLNFKSDLYTHNVLSIELSATLEPKEKFMKDMYKLMFPMECRITMKYHRYAEAINLTYRFADPKKIRCKMRGRYSHTEFEKSIRRNKKLLSNYYEFNKNLLDNIFMQNYEVGQRSLVFFGLVEMCKEFGAYIQDVYPDNKVTVYTSGSKEESLKENDIIISTLKSCGTARDIPNLTCVLNTVAVDTPQGNIQYFGRLRELKNQPHIVPKYHWTTATNIDKHVKYSNNREYLFSDKATNVYTLDTCVTL